VAGLRGGQDEGVAGGGAVIAAHGREVAVGKALPDLGARTGVAAEAARAHLRLVLLCDIEEGLLPAAHNGVLVDGERRGQQALVYVAQENKAEMRPVRLGRASGPRFEVLEGLAEGDLAIVRGNERLRPGQAVVLPGAEPGNPDSGAKTG